MVDLPGKKFPTGLNKYVRPHKWDIVGEGLFYVLFVEMQGSKRRSRVPERLRP